MVIKGFRVPLGESLEVRGTVSAPGGAGTTAGFIPATGTNGLIARSVNVPGGLLGIDLPIPGNQVAATAQLAGPVGSLRVDVDTFTLQMPLKLKLSNPLIGSNCYIGSNANPARLTLIVGTTSPPRPNTPISGRVGAISFPNGGIQFTGNVNVDNSFAIPGATGCGFLGLGLIDLLVNAKLGLPSAAGNNTASIVNDVAIGGL